MTMIKIQFRLLSSILNASWWSSFVKLYSQDTSWCIYCILDYAKLSRCCCQPWQEFQQTEADQNLQQISYDRQHIILISHIVNWSFTCALSRIGWCHKAFCMPKGSLKAISILQ